MMFNKDQIKHLVDRFLRYKLPENFAPDGGVSFERLGNKGTPHEYKRDPCGTNLLDATQADAMVRYMIEGIPSMDRKMLAKALWKMTCHEEERDLRADHKDVPARWADPWDESGCGINQQKRYLRQADYIIAILS